MPRSRSPAFRSSPSSRRAFTLIELLIVIAIIAILALIAIPNFLEAQVRSKVSRSLADMRSVATALESYFVDNNAYPLIPSGPAAPGWDDPHFWLVPLTTPVGHITRLPKYPWKPVELNWGQPFLVDYYYYNEWESFYAPGGLPWSIWDARDTSRWYLSAAGPDGDLDQDWTLEPGSNNNPYDPTNGTISDGDLVRVGP